MLLSFSRDYAGKATHPSSASRADEALSLDRASEGFSSSRSPPVGVGSENTVSLSSLEYANTTRRQVGHEAFNRNQGSTQDLQKTCSHSKTITLWFGCKFSRHKAHVVRFWRSSWVRPAVKSCQFLSPILHEGRLWSVFREAGPGSSETKKALLAATPSSSPSLPSCNMIEAAGIRKFVVSSSYSPSMPSMLSFPSSCSCKTLCNKFLS